MNRTNYSKSKFIDNKRIIISLIITLASFTILYQLRPFVNDEQFMWISIPTYAIVPGILTVYAAILTIKLFKQKHFQAKAFLFFTFGAAFWFIAEQIWQMYDHVWEGNPFPSEADIFYVAAYPCHILFILISLKPILKSINRNVWFFAAALSFSFLIPSVLAAYDDIGGDEAYAASIALAYPIMSSIQLIPAIVGVMYLAKKPSNLSWMLILFGFILYNVSDTYFLFAELDGSYFDGHPVDLLYVYSFLLFIFAFHHRLKYLSLSDTDSSFFSEKIHFETISKFGIPLTLAIACMVILISMVDAVFTSTDDNIAIQSLLLGIIAMIGVFAVIVITINKNLSRLVRMRTEELIEQRNNLENLVEEKTHALLKTERLSAIGELSGRLAHDLRNPLSVMKMSVDLIKQNSKDTKISDPIITKRIDLIEKSIDRISHQVDDVLGYVRNSPLSLSHISLRQLVENSIEKINIPNDVNVTISKKDVLIDCDPIKLDAVFINLIVNSIQAMSEGGTLDIEISDHDNMAIIEFIDSGKGIQEENISKVFEPLFTTKQKGTGLGLASCKNIVEQHQGNITVKNNPTTFTIILPKSMPVSVAKHQIK